MNIWIEAVGLLAGFLTTVSFVPQVLYVVRTKSVENISLIMYILFCLGVLLWLIYGFLLGSLAVILANTVTLCLATTVLFCIIRYRK